MVFRDALLSDLRREYSPSIPKQLQSIETLKPLPQGEAHSVIKEIADLLPNSSSNPKLHFASNGEGAGAPLRVGVVLSGGQAAGGHNVISALYDALMRFNEKSTLYGFLDGPSGIIDNKRVELTKEKLAPFRNQGGFDLLGSGRTKIETKEQFIAATNTASTLKLDGLVIIGGDDSNTNAALLAEHFLKEQVSTTVVGVPKTIDGDLKTEEIETSFGFDTATKCFSATIGDIARDALSAKKYYFFVKLMGRSASHVTLECALNTHPNYTLIGEELARDNKSLKAVVKELADLIEERHLQGKHYGVVLIPEGIVEFIHDLTATIDELPEAIREQFSLERDPHGNIQVSKIESERLLITLVKEELTSRSYKGPFSAQPIFCGYEGRSCLPSNFDAHYCYSLGLVAAVLLRHQATGYMAAIQNLAAPVAEWVAAGIPIAPMMNLEERKGKRVPVIKKALVDLDGAPFKQFLLQREKWRLNDNYRYPGPIQFFGPKELTECTTITLTLEGIA